MKKKRCKNSNNVQYYIPFLIFGIIISITKDTDAVCYFPPELQGEFITQSATNHENEVIYTRVNITEDSIPIWGECHKRFNGSNIILRVDSEDSSCFRCFHVNLVARNILRVHTAEQDYISRCYTNEEKAIESCPNIDTFKDRNSHREIILYKIYDYNGENIQRQYCPITGRYRYSYSAINGTGATIQCNSKESEMDSCPSGSAMNFRFRHCNFQSYETTLECLGHWTGYDGQKYMILVNTGVGEGFGPDYRCATFEEDEETGVKKISFSIDSLCSNEPSKDHKELLVLYPNEDSPWGQEYDYCNLPKWMYGAFEYLTIDEKEVVYRDPVSFKTYVMKCLGLFQDTKNPNHEEETSIRVLTLSQTQCGERQFQCIWINKRSNNIFEFQIGAKAIQYKKLWDPSDPDINNNIESICDDQYFDKSQWTTQGRYDNRYETSPCPINGEFIGYIPDAEGLCARMWSGERADIMFYEVSSCEYGEVYDDREYQCVGQWSENNVIYTYTKRLDVPTYECFVGALYTDDEIFIKEASSHCLRDVDPYRYGMQLKKISKKNNSTNDEMILSPKNITDSNTIERVSYRNEEKQTTINVDISRPPNEIVYDDYEEPNHHEKNISQIQDNRHMNHNNSVENDTVVIVNINRTETNVKKTVQIEEEKEKGKEKAEDEEVAMNDTIHSTIHRITTTDHTNTQHGAKTKYNKDNMSFSDSNINSNRSIFTILVLIGLSCVSFYFNNVHA